MQVLQDFKSIPLWGTIIAIVSLFPLLRTYTHAATRTKFDMIFQTKDEKIWQRFIKTILNSVFVNIALFLVSTYLKATDDPAADLVKNQSVNITLTIVILTALIIWIFIPVALMCIKGVLKLRGINTTGSRLRNTYIILICTHFVITVYAYATVMVSYFVVGFDVTTFEYTDCVFILIWVAIPVGIYYAYMVWTPRILLNAAEKKTYYKLSIPSEVEQTSLRLDELFILYSIDSKRIVLCKDIEGITSQKTLYVYDYERDRYYKYEMFSTE